MKRRLVATQTKKEPSTNKLIIGEKGESVLSFEQQQFNALIKKLESLQKSYEKKSKTLADCMSYFNTQVTPRKIELAKEYIPTVKVLYPLYTAPKGLTKPEKAYLSEEIELQLNTIVGMFPNLEDVEIDTIFKDFFGYTVKQDEQDRLNTIKQEMREMAAAFGIELDEELLRNATTQEEMMERILEFNDKVNGKTGEPGGDAETDPMTEEEGSFHNMRQQVDEAKNKDMSALYKKLAKVLHPDLEQDANMKAKKEELMKQLTVAYEKNDIHTMLKLELDWIKKEEGAINQMSNETIAVYSQALKEQIMDLMQAIDGLYDEPRYAELIYTVEGKRNINKKYLAMLAIEVGEIAENTRAFRHNLEGPGGLQYLKKSIKMEKAAEQEFDVDASLEDLAELLAKAFKIKRPKGNRK